MMTVAGPTVIVPDRLFFPVFLSTENWTVPEPDPDAPELIEIQEAFDFAVQGQPPLAETEIDPVPAALPMVSEVGATEMLPDWKVPVMLSG